MNPILINGVAGGVAGPPPGGVTGSLGSTGYTYVRGRWMFSCGDNVNGDGTEGSFSIWDCLNVSLTSPPVLVGQIVDPSLYYIEGVWVNPELTYAVVAVMGGPTSGEPQIANASVQVISIAPCISAYLASSSYVAPTVAYTLQPGDGTLDSPENLLVPNDGPYAYVSNVFSTGTNDYARIDLSALPALSISGTPISHSSLSGAVYGVFLGNTIYVTSRGGHSISQIDMTSFTLIGTPLSLTGYLTGIDIAYYPSLGKIFAFVAGTQNNSLFSVDVTNASSMSLEATLTSSTNYRAISNTHVVGTVVYSTEYYTLSGITKTDISDPYHPVFVSFTSTTDLGLSGTQMFDHLEIPQVGVPDGLEGRGYQSDTSSIGGVYVLQLFDTVAFPAFNPIAGTYEISQSVSITTSTPGCAIRYTTDGSAPSKTHGTIYTVPILISSTTTVKAIAYQVGWIDSLVATAVFTIGSPSPVLTSLATQQARGLGTTTLIPLTSAPNQSMTVNLPINGGSVSLQLKIRYNENGVNGNFWTMDVADRYGVPLVASVPLVTGVWPAANVLAPYDYLRIGSAYVVNMSAGALDIPDSVSLGSSFVLLWGPND